jgi:hypothetical protein
VCSIIIVIAVDTRLPYGSLPGSARESLPYFCHIYNRSEISKGSAFAETDAFLNYAGNGNVRASASRSGAPELAAEGHPRNRNLIQSRTAMTAPLRLFFDNVNKERQRFFRGIVGRKVAAIEAGFARRAL